jgi:hypothetical protein
MVYGLDDRGSIPGRAEQFSLRHSVQTLSGIHPVFYPMGTGDSSPVCRAAGGVKLTTHLHLVPRSRMMELYLHFPIRLDGVVLN